MGKNSIEWTPERRATHGEAVRCKMQDPAVREKISSRTREAMVLKNRPELVMLRLAWRAASSSGRVQFLTEIFAELIK